MVYGVLVVIGLFVGSFLNVVALRYDPERFVLAPSAGGRSRCPSCARSLRWFELLPLVSFLLQRGRCRSCGIALSWRYPIVELLTAGAFVLAGFFVHGVVGLALVVWCALVATLLLIALIDFDQHLIPDELTVFVVILGCISTALTAPVFGVVTGSLIGPYAALFGWRDAIVINHLIGAVAAAALLGVLYIGSRGRGIGLGDVKLIAALGIVFGWPDALLIAMLAFVVGTLAVLPLLLRRQTSLRHAVPFGPALVAATFILMGWGEPLVRAYFGLFRG